ncbi:hypothetical protein BT63DRAFT_458474 [Microthyrium microscopicum]|uniref:Uncharacterized protein n=1 Tax=Microthyrium microscopicum TaxID=703497 RepID=A0A6A6U2G2_9PEZI|nr:hypothetical protein BT63DRAFT_458474 [Microthyrium microscopicum]
MNSSFMTEEVEATSSSAVLIELLWEGESAVHVLLPGFRDSDETTDALAADLDTFRSQLATVEIELKTRSVQDAQCAWCFNTLKMDGLLTNSPGTILGLEQEIRETKGSAFTVDQTATYFGGSPSWIPGMLGILRGQLIMDLSALKMRIKIRLIKGTSDEITENVGKWTRPRGKQMRLANNTTSEARSVNIAGKEVSIEEVYGNMPARTAGRVTDEPGGDAFG